MLCDQRWQIYFWLHLLFIALISAKTTKTRPNIVLIMADDLGIGDIGCFGNDTIKTPNIDRMAKEGAKMTHFLAASAMCTPSRTAFLTGRYPVRSGMAGSNLLPVITVTGSPAGLPSHEITLAEIAKQSGYKTGLIGKWHLGLNKDSYGDNEHHPNNQGFDYFFGIPLTNLREFGGKERSSILAYLPRIQAIVFTGTFMGVVLAIVLYHGKHINMCTLFAIFFLVVLLFVVPYVYVTNMEFMNSLLMRNNDVVEQPIRFNNLTQTLVKEGVSFLEERKQDGSPFLLFMSWLQVHTVLHTAPEFEGHSLHGRYGDNVEEMDWSVGQILLKLEELGLMNNTFVLFTSDQGGHVEEKNSNGEREGGYNGIYRGGKMQGGMEGGIRVPTTVMWPGHVTPGHVINEPLSNMDVFTTVAELVGQDVPDDRVIDGHNLIPILKGESKISSHEFLVHYCADKIHAVRWRPREGKAVWKVRYTTPAWIPGTEECYYFCQCADHIYHEEPLVFDIQSDPREEHPIDKQHLMYQKIIDVTSQAVQDHKSSIVPVENQFSFGKGIWRYYLQPCCNFPSCNCQE